MKLSQLLSALNVKHNIPDTEITDIVFDSRKATKGTLFVAINGETVDGHNFAVSAEQNGASVIVAEHKTESTLPHIIVSDSRTAMSQLCAVWFSHPERSLKFIGVTGTNGKTSTAFYIKRILDKMGLKTGLVGTVCNMIGDTVIPASVTTPEPYALFSLFADMVKSGVTHVVMEVSSHSIVQKRVHGLHFDSAVFTNLSQDHLDYHGTMENYKAAKRELFLQTDTAVINIDDKTGKEYFDEIDCKKLTFSTLSNTADFVGKDIKLKPSGVSFQAVTLGGIARVTIASPGKFMVYNALGAIGAVCALGYKFLDVLPHIASLGAVDGRAQIISGERPYTVMIDYAHTPDGLENILSSVKQYAQGRVITLFGCGGDRDRTKRPIMAKMACKYSDFVIVTSDNPRTEDPSAIINDILEGMTLDKKSYVVIENRRDAIRYAVDMAENGDFVVLAGKGHEKYQILGREKVDFDEEKITLDIMKELGK